MSQHKRRCWKQGGEGRGRKCNKRCWDILNKLLTISPPPRNTPMFQAIVPWGGGHCPFHEYMQEICTYPSTITFSGPFQRNWKHGWNMVKLFGNSFTFSNHANMQSLWGSTSLITISTPPTTPKGFADICRIYKGFVSFWRFECISRKGTMR